MAEELQEQKPQEAVVTPEVTPTDPREEIIGDIKKMQEGIVPDEPQGTQEAQGSQELPTDIPDEFSDAALKAGFTEEELKEFASDKTDDELKELIPYLESYKEQDEEEFEEEPKPEKKIEVPEIDQAVLDRVEKQLAEKWGVSLEEIKNLKEERELEKQSRNASTMIDKLDKAAEKFPIFGKHADLPKFNGGKMKGMLIPNSPEFKARDEVTQNAQIFMQSGLDAEKAMDKAIALYAGEHLQKEVERNVYKGLKQFERNLSGPRAGKEVIKKYASEREEIIDDIRMMQRAMGQDK